MVRPVITTHKHIRQVSFATVSIGDIANIDVCVAKQSPNRSISTEVEIGSIVKAVYVEMWLLGDGQAVGTASNSQ